MEMMEKKEYIAPSIELVLLSGENLMVTASPGVDGDYDPTKPIESKPAPAFEEEDEDGETVQMHLGTNPWTL